MEICVDMSTRFAPHSSHPQVSSAVAGGVSVPVLFSAPHRDPSPVVLVVEGKRCTQRQARRRRLLAMSGSISATATQPQAQRSAAQTLQSERLFYVIAGSVMLLATALG